MRVNIRGRDRDRAGRRLEKISPARDGHLFLHHFPALRTTLLSLSPSRDESSAHTPNPNVDAHGQPPDRGQIIWSASLRKTRKHAQLRVDPCLGLVHFPGSPL